MEREEPHQNIIPGDLPKKASSGVQLEKQNLIGKETPMFKNPSFNIKNPRMHEPEQQDAFVVVQTDDPRRPRNQSSDELEMADEISDTVNSVVNGRKIFSDEDLPMRRQPMSTGPAARKMSNTVEKTHSL